MLTALLVLIMSLNEPLLVAAAGQDAGSPLPGAMRRDLTVEIHAPRSTGVVSGTNKLSRASIVAGSGSHDTLSMRAHIISFIVNMLLLAAKVCVYIRSDSMAVLASLVDSAVDICAQGMLMVANRLTSRDDRVMYPAGRARLEPVSVISCALLMALASAQVMRDAVTQLLGGDNPVLKLGAMDFGFLLATILFKFVLLLWCKAVYAQTGNVTVEALATDNFNDVLSNSAALLAALLAMARPELWASDPIGAILIGAYIIFSWIQTGREQLEMIIGKAADPDFLDVVREMAETHDPAASLDVVRAYHFGPKFLVEIEIVMAEDTPLRESHDVGILLQHKIERLEEVDRCFVHVDYQAREVDDHDPMTPIEYKMFASRKLPPIGASPEDAREDSSA
jgi:cation diffusion facilitator family transporter